MADIFNIVTGPFNTSSGSALAASIMNRAAEILLAIAVPVAIAGVFYTAWILISKPQETKSWETAKKNIIYIFTGLAIIIFSVTALRILHTFVSGMTVTTTK